MPKEDVDKAWAELRASAKKKREKKKKTKEKPKAKAKPKKKEPATATSVKTPKITTTTLPPAGRPNVRKMAGEAIDRSPRSSTGGPARTAQRRRAKPSSRLDSKPADTPEPNAYQASLNNIDKRTQGERIRSKFKRFFGIGADKEPNGSK